MIPDRKGTPAVWSCIRSVSAVVAASLTLVACVANDSRSDAESERGSDHNVVSVARTRLFADSTVAIASAAGWFEEAGIEVSVLEAQTTTDAIPLLLTGEADVIYSGFSPALARAMAQGDPIRAVAVGSVSASRGCSDYGLVMTPEARTSFDLSDPDSVRKMTIGGPFGAGFVGLWMLDEFASELGLELSDLTLREVSLAQAAPTLAGGGVDALLAAEPALTRLREELDAELVLPVSEVVPGLARSALFFGPRLLEQPDLAARYLAVHLRALARHSQGPTEENIAALSGPTGLEPNLLAEMCWAPMDGATRPYESVVTAAFEFARSSGLIDEIPSPDQVWDHSVRERALDLLDQWSINLDD